MKTPPITRRSERIRTPALPRTATPSARKQTGNKKKGTSAERILQVGAGEQRDPRTYSEAIRSKDADEWKKAMAVELQNMDRLGVWDGVEKGTLPKELKTVGSRWIFTTKRQGENTKFKARLVARGDQELPNTDDTYSPTASMSLVRTVFSLVATWGLQLSHWDVTTAFLNAELGTTPVYMRPPQGMDGNVLLKLKKAIYGLRRSPRRWHDKVKPVIQSLGLKQSTVEPCLFYKITPSSVFLLVLFVDDFKVAYHQDDVEFFRRVKEKMFSTFKMNDVEDSRFVGVEYRCTEDGGIVLHQERYLSSSLEEAGSDAKTDTNASWTEVTSL
jgi:hypothetical protein